VIETHLEWQMTPKTEPRWKIEGRYITTIQGDPMIIDKQMILPATGTPHTLMNPDYFASLGMTITGMPALNAMRCVVAAKPGLLTRGPAVARVRREIRPALSYSASAASIAARSAGSSGATRGLKRAFTCPSLPTTNFAKFQATSPVPSGCVFALVSQA
jgi:hypothetical protein